MKKFGSQSNFLPLTASSGWRNASLRGSRITTVRADNVLFLFLSTVGGVDVNGGVSGRGLVGSRAGGETHDDDDDDRHDGERRCGGSTHYMCE